MKKIFFFLLLFSSLAAAAQTTKPSATVNAKRLIANDSLKLNGKWYKTLDVPVKYPVYVDVDGKLTADVGSGGGPNAWLKAGNSGITGSDFLGSTNSAALRFRTNNIERGFFDIDGSFAINSFANNFAYDSAFYLKNNAGYRFFNIATSSTGSILTLDANNATAGTPPGGGLTIGSYGNSPDSFYNRSYQGAVFDFYNTFRIRHRGVGNGITWTPFEVAQGNANYLTVKSYNGVPSTIFGTDTTYRASATVAINSTVGGLLIPRLTTTQRDAIASPANGLLIYNTSTLAFNYFNGTAWTAIGSGGGGGTLTNPITFNNSGSGAASGTTADGSSAVTVSYNTIGAAPATSGNSILKGNGSGGFSNATAGTDYLAPNELTAFYFTDFVTNASNFPWNGAAISSGTAAATTATLSGDHPGVSRFSSSTSANSGYRIGTDLNSIRLKGGEESVAIINPTDLSSGTTVRVGFLDNTTSTDAVDGVYFEWSGSGAIILKTSNNSTQSSSSTITTLSTSTWYKLKIVVTSTSSVTGYVYNATGTLINSATLTTNIPSTSGREVGVGLVATNSGTTATALIDVDYLSVKLLPVR